jgi:multicomponent K+:H+ antiporter subunit G
MPLWLDALVAALVLVGVAFALLGSFALVKLSDFAKRLHGPTKATTLGVGAVLIASALHFSWRDGAASVHELLITFFLMLVAPVSAHVLAKAAMRIDRSLRAPPRPDAAERAAGRDPGAPPGGEGKP